MHDRLTLFFLLVLISCACAPPAPDFGECNRDTDCAEDQRCVNGACLIPLIFIDLGVDAELDAAPDATRDLGPRLSCETVAIPDEERRSVCGRACTLDGFARIVAGTFQMGAPPGELYRFDGNVPEYEEPQHSVTLTRDYWLKTTEVTRAEWESLRHLMPGSAGQLLPAPCADEACPPDCRAADCPARQVSWYGALAWANALSRAEDLPECYTLTDCSLQPGDVGNPGMQCAGVSVNAVGRNPLNCKGYRLPSEAEWEYAIRAGTQAAWYSGADEAAVDTIAWYRDNANGQPHPVATKRPNGWGLYDMAGNVPEWVWDGASVLRSAEAVDPLGLSSSPHKIFRGGGFHMGIQRTRSAARPNALPIHNQQFGFRVARTILICGDGICDAAETTAQCPADCPLDGFVIVPQGQGWLGSPADEPGREMPAAGARLAEPRRETRLLQSVWAKATEVTEQEWQGLMDAAGAAAECPSCPKADISWFDALRWCNARSRADNLPECYRLADCDEQTGCAVAVTAPNGDPQRCAGYRLPTEAEWEYAARAGREAVWFHGDDDPGAIAWFAENAEDRQPVGHKSGNCWGLYDTAGNLHEWAWDDSGGAVRDLVPNPVTPPTDTGKRVVRGGAFTSTAGQIRTAARMEWAPQSPAPDIGFRPVRTIIAPVTLPAWRIGQRGPAGGWVFYDKGVRTNGWRYLELAPSDQSLRTSWGCTGADLRDFAHWIGSGARNNQLILDGCAARPIAASIADGFDDGQFADWFLPSLQAWKIIQPALIDRGIGDLAEVFYWSATTNRALDFAWIWQVNLMEDGVWCRGCAARVRAIRRF